MAFCVLIGGIAGVVGGFGLLEWITVIAYPHNVGARPLNSWPAYIPITFEMYDSARRAHRFGEHAGDERTSPALSPGVQCRRHFKEPRDKFFLCIESSDPKFRTDETVRFSRCWGERGERCSGIRHGIQYGLPMPVRCGALRTCTGVPPGHAQSAALQAVRGDHFFGDGRSARPAIDDTVARGQLHIDQAR